MLRKEIYEKMDEFERVVMITNFVRNISNEVNVNTKQGSREAKERFRKYLNEEIPENEQ